MDLTGPDAGSIDVTRQLVEWSKRAPEARDFPTLQPQERYEPITYRTRKSWSRERRVVGKAEHLAKGANPRFVVTSLSADEAAYAMQPLCENVYCACGNMENRIKVVEQSSLTGS